MKWAARREACGPRSGHLTTAWSIFASPATAFARISQGTVVGRNGSQAAVQVEKRNTRCRECRHTARDADGVIAAEAVLDPGRRLRIRFAPDLGMGLFLSRGFPPWPRGGQSIR